MTTLSPQAVLIDQSKVFVRGRLLSKESLAAYTSWRIGGLADYLYFPADWQDVSTLLQQLPKTMPITFMGLGSNTLVRDGGVSGLVVVTQGAFNRIDINENHVRSEAGVASAQLARAAARAGLRGLEFLAGVPGTVGGALVMNAGCFGGETWQTVYQVETMSRDGVIRQRPHTDFTVSYREVVSPHQDEWFIAGHFKLQRGNKEESLTEIRTLLERRNATQPTGTANSGSVFRNPHKDYAGRLIESCGLKGLQYGGAAVSTKHANFIINEGKATAFDIESLITKVQGIVLAQTGVALLPEVRIIGRELIGE